MEVGLAALGRARARLAAGITLALACAGVWTCAGLGVAAASAAQGKLVRYRGYSIVVPRSWPVYDLAADPTVCVRFNRHAVYLGSPSTRQRCPAHEVGRTEAILLQGPGVQPPSGSAARLAVPDREVTVSASWSRSPGTVARALGTRSLHVVADADAAGARAATARAATARASATPGVYTGLGFDVCSAPTTAQMSDWRSSPYHAMGIYIGGTNSACSQPNLTKRWVSTESARGWHLIPTYVGLQAPGACSCASISTTVSTARRQGASAAADAISDAAALGLGAGNPIYFDMEAYPTGGRNTPAVLAFLASWTAKLHAAGYISGVYSSGASGIHDLNAKWGTSYSEPDDLWIADWNGKHSTADPYVGSGAWSAHHRLHQYSGGSNETHGGVTLNIDGDYLDGATAAAGQTAVTPAAAPSLAVQLAVNGAVQLQASWPGASDIASWQVLAGDTSDALTPLGTAAKGGAAAAITVHSQLDYYAVQALTSAGELLATTPAVAAKPHLAIYGRSSFVPTHGPGGLPVGCYTGSACQLTTTVTSGRTLIASGGPQSVTADEGGIVYFKLSSTGRSLLANAPGRRLAVSVRVTDASGVSAKTTLNLVPFSTQGRAPGRNLSQSPTLNLIGATDFVYRSAVGGILAGCFSEVPCIVSTKIVAGHATIARAGPQFLGANELEYLMFRLTAKGKALLMHARGNQLGAKVTVSDGSARAVGHIVLVSFK